MHVLVVENDLDTRDLLNKALIDAGYDVSQARGFGQALRLLNERPDISVVVVDLRTCAHFTDIQMAAQIRQRLDNRHYILTFSDWEAIEPACHDDMSVLRKPYGKLDLLRAVRRGVARRNQKPRVSAFNGTRCRRA